MLLYLLYVIIFLGVLHIIFNYNERARMMRKIPGPPLDFIVGNMLTIIKSPVDIVKMGREFAKMYDGIYRLWIYPFSGVILYNPDDIELIMSSMQYTDKSILYKFLKPWLGDGLLISKGTKWQERRKILTPTFHFNILKQFCEVIDENCDKFVITLHETAGKPIDVLPVLSEFTLSSICETAMGTKLNEHASDSAKSYKQAIQELIDLLFERIIRIYLYSDLVYSLSRWGRKQSKYIKTIHDFTEAVVEQRKEYMNKKVVDVDHVDDDDFNLTKKKKKTAMLDLLLSAEKEGLIDKTGIQEEVDTFMFEGHDTTASGLTFCLMLLANHRTIQMKIRQELNEIFGETKRSIKMEDLNRMKYLECCIKESLRMYPPVFFISRNLNETTVLSKRYTVPPGTHCHISIYDLHYRKDLFKDPEQFNPDRFLPENCLGRHPYAYIPFAAGPRNCIGQKFAMMEMKIAITKILLEFDLLPVTRIEDICFTANIVLRNNEPVLVNFIKREH